MLVLTRKVGERVLIDGGKITVTVTRIDRNQIGLGFEADRNIDIVREEVVNGPGDKSGKPKGK